MEYNVMWVASNLAGAAGALGAEARGTAAEGEERAGDRMGGGQGVRGVVGRYYGGIRWGIEQKGQRQYE